MAARFVNKRAIHSVDELNPIERAQLQLAGKAYDGEDRPVEDRLAPQGEDELDGSFASFCHLWQIVDGDRLLYDAWVFMVDSGMIFRAGTTEHVASIIQFGLECEDPEMRLEIGAAMAAAELL